MNTFKKFLNKKKVQNHFKKSGGGVRLAGESSSSNPSITTGSAQSGASGSKRRIQMIARRETEEERKQLKDLKLEKTEKPEQDIREFEHSSAITQVLYTCELLGEDVVKPKRELMKDLEHFLKEQVDTADDDGDKIIAAVLMLYSLNKQQQRDTAIETICKYVQNILEHPGEEKYRSIRLGNKAFRERVVNVIGGRKFLESVGFTEKSDEFLVFDRDSDIHLVEALENLRNGQSVPIKVARNLEIFSTNEGQKLVSPKLADDFFNLTADELKQEQRSRENQVDRKSENPGQDKRKIALSSVLTNVLHYLLKKCVHAGGVFFILITLFSLKLVEAQKDDEILRVYGLSLAVVEYRTYSYCVVNRCNVSFDVTFSTNVTSFDEYSNLIPMTNGSITPSSSNIQTSSFTWRATQIPNGFSCGIIVKGLEGYQENYHFQFPDFGEVKEGEMLFTVLTNKKTKSELGIVYHMFSKCN